MRCIRANPAEFAGINPAVGDPGHDFREIRIASDRQLDLGVISGTGSVASQTMDPSDSCTQPASSCA